MKLCPECDFIYEDDQAVCDMDGKQLVPQPLPESVSAPVAASAPKVASHGSKRWFALAAGLALLLAVIAVAYVSQASQRRAYAASSSIPSVAVETTPQPVSVPPETPAAVDSSEANNTNATAREASTKMLTNVAATAANAVFTGRRARLVYQAAAKFLAVKLRWRFGLSAVMPNPLCACPSSNASRLAPQAR